SFCRLILLPHSPTLFPYTTLFRSRDGVGQKEPRARHSRGLRSAHRRRRAAEHGAGIGEIDGVSVYASARRFAAASTFSASFTLRSEEHTSELQSRENLVCRLLLEK